MSRHHYLGAALAVAYALVHGFGSVRVDAQVQAVSPPQAFTPRTDALCTTTVELPAAPAGGQPPAAAAPAAAAPVAGAGPRLVKIKDDVYVIQNAEESFAQIGQYGGNVTVYLTNDGVILFDSKNERMHDDIVAKVRTLTDKPIKYVVLTHNHGDHAGGAAKMQAAGATVIGSEATRKNMDRLPSRPAQMEVYKDTKDVVLGGKTVQLREFCGHTGGDTVAFLPGARVVIVGDLVTLPDAIPPAVNYRDGGNWTDLLITLDALSIMEFDFMVGGHGPVITSVEFMRYRDKVAAVRERFRELNRKNVSQEEILQTLAKEYNFSGGGQVPGMMIELKAPRPLPALDR